MNALPLFDWCGSRHNGNAQSDAAFDSIKNDLTEMENEVLQFIERQGLRGSSIDEMAAATGKAPNQISGRFTSLKAANKIMKIGTRPTRSGRSAGVFVSTGI